jgi:hypothetical protein
MRHRVGLVAELLAQRVEPGLREHRQDRLVSLDALADEWRGPGEEPVVARVEESLVPERFRHLGDGTRGTGVVPSSTGVSELLIEHSRNSNLR